MLLGTAATGKHFTDGHIAACQGLCMQHTVPLRTEAHNPIHLKATALKFLEPERSNLQKHPRQSSKELMEIT